VNPDAVKAYLARFKNLPNILESIPPPVDAGPTYIAERLAVLLNDEDRKKGGLGRLEFSRGRIEKIVGVPLHSIRKILKTFGWKLQIRKLVVVFTKIGD
jgi:hypothetical protein